MADGTTLNAGTGGDVIATDDIGGVKHQRVKVQHGADGAASDVSATNPLPVTGEIIERINLAAGNYSGYSAVNKFGDNHDIDSGAEEDLWSAGGSYTGWLTSATLVEAVSASADDASAGTGARTIQIWGLDASYAEQTEVITLNGTTAVDSSSTYIRVFRARVLTAGSGGTAAGAITIRVDGAGATVAEIPLGYNQTEMAIYTVPAGKTAYIFGIFASGGDTLSRAFIDVELKVRESGGVFCTKFDLQLASDGTAAFQRQFTVPIVAAAQSDIVMTAGTDQDNTHVSGSFDLVLVDD